MTKRIIAVLCVLCLVLGLAACSGETSTEDDWTSCLVGGDGVLRVAINNDYPPFEYIDENGELTGLDRDLAQYIADYLGLELEIVPTKWDAIIATVNIGQADLGIGCFSYSRDRNVLFSETYFKTCQALFVNTGSGYDTIESLSGTKISASEGATGWSYAEGLAEYYNFKVVDNQDIQMILEGVANGTYSAGVMEEIVIETYINETDGAYKIIETNAVEEIKTFTRNGNDVLIEKVNEAINALLEDPYYDELIEKYF